MWLKFVSIDCGCRNVHCAHGAFRFRLNNLNLWNIPWRILFRIQCDPSRANKQMFAILIRSLINLTDTPVFQFKIGFSCFRSIIFSFMIPALGQLIHIKKTVRNVFNSLFSGFFLWNKKSTLILLLHDHWTCAGLENCWNQKWNTRTGTNGQKRLSYYFWHHNANELNSNESIITNKRRLCG